MGGVRVARSDALDQLFKVEIQSVRRQLNPETAMRLTPLGTQREATVKSGDDHVYDTHFSNNLGISAESRCPGTIRATRFLLQFPDVDCPRVGGISIRTQTGSSIGNSAGFDGQTNIYIYIYIYMYISIHIYCSNGDCTASPPVLL